MTKLKECCLHILNKDLFLKSSYFSMKLIEIDCFIDENSKLMTFNNEIEDEFQIKFE